MGTEMRRMLVAGTIVALAAAAAQAGVITTYSFEKTVTVGSTIVDVFRITMTADDPNNKVGAVAIGFGNGVDPNDPSVKVTPGHGDDPYQAWMQYSEAAVFKTTSQTDANSYVLPQDPSAAYADTHFLYTGWTPVVFNPNEFNDYSLADPGTGMGVAQGKGGMYVVASVKLEDRQYSMDICQVGVVRGDIVWPWTYSSDDLGDTTEQEFLVPEPATVALLAVGAFALLGRRRR